MKLLHIYRSEPTQDVTTLVDILSEGNESTHFELFREGEVDYDLLVELVFSNDKTVSWW